MSEPPAPRRESPDATGRGGEPPPPRRRGRLWAVFIFLAIALAMGLGLSQIASFEELRQQRDVLLGLVADHAVLAFAAYFAIYAVATLAMVPGTLWITIGGGLMFGLLPGAATTVAAGTTGAVCLFLLARTSFGGVLHRRAGKWLRQVEAGFRADAPSYMLALRFMPVVPYPVANLAPALLGARFRDFLLTTPPGLVPSVTAYTWIGAGLGQAFDAGTTPDLMRLAFALAPAFMLLGVIALAPVAYKYVVRRRRRARRNKDDLAVATERSSKSS